MGLELVFGVGGDGVNLDSQLVLHPPTQTQTSNLTPYCFLKLKLKICLVLLPPTPTQTPCAACSPKLKTAAITLSGAS
jgi:hypothetical protein